MKLPTKIVVLFIICAVGGIIAGFIDLLIGRLLGEAYKTWFGGFIRGFIIVLVSMIAAIKLFRK